eukprot:NODE_1753_length_1417_cov_20.991959_g1582_i0.p2 GENE.NODE_1753_length_1417_cov_20.991959_g1582_i0~~NODE_1753_length_1417_cov_20.991959_g1582_i0.p2  ORF type:complete len:132 (-),score=12.28 NODE_1753_length_1417_cov_20.991959_g1582_i0:864-1259(-)
MSHSFNGAAAPAGIASRFQPERKWTAKETARLLDAQCKLDATSAHFFEMVADAVGTRTKAECLAFMEATFISPEKKKRRKQNLPAKVSRCCRALEKSQSHRDDIFALHFSSMMSPALPDIPQQGILRSSVA